MISDEVAGLLAVQRTKAADLADIVPGGHVIGRAQLLALDAFARGLAGLFALREPGFDRARFYALARGEAPAIHDMRETGAHRRED